MEEREFADVSAAEQTRTVHFATNRKRTDSDDLFTGEFASTKDANTMYTGTIQARFGGSADPVWRPDPKTLKLDPTTSLEESLNDIDSKISGNSLEETSIETFVSKLPRTASGAGDGLFFVHGYNTSFLEAISSSAKLSAGYDITDVLCYSWPSLGSIAGYAADATHAQNSDPSLATALFRLLNALPQGRHIQFLCHSMGAFALSSALQRIVVQNRTTLERQYFYHAVLAAADEFWGALSYDSMLKKLIGLSSDVSIYTNIKDKLLNFSSEIHGHEKRLGQWGPESFEKLPKNVLWVECSKVADNGLFQTGHGYFRDSPKVIDDIRSLLHGGAPHDRYRELS